jgi:hypothetical protein
MKINKNNSLIILFLIVILVSYLLYSSKEGFQKKEGFQRKKIIQPKFYTDINGPLNIVESKNSLTTNTNIPTESFTDASMNIPSSYNIFTNNNINVPVYDQFQTETCVANSISTALAYLLKLNNPTNPIELPSRVFIYILGKAIDYQSIDCSLHKGLQGFNIINYLNFYKIPSETELPFPTEEESGTTSGDVGSLCIVPPNSIIKYDNNRKLIFQTFDKAVLPNDRINAIKYSLSKNRIIIIALRMFSSFFTSWNNNGRLVLPATSGETWFGGHSLVIIGYNDSNQTLTVRNSWGNTGDNGNGYLPYEYVTTPTLYQLTPSLNGSLITGIYELQSYGTPHNISLNTNITDTNASNLFYDYISLLFRGNLYT